MNCDVSAKDIRKLFIYCPSTGIFLYKVSRGRMAAGDVAGRINSHGYRQIGIHYKRHQAHRLAWLYVYGKWPKHGIDHINGVKDDNRIDNLRDVDAHVNQQNRRRASKGSATGLLGVSRLRGKYIAQIMVFNKPIYLGLFNTAKSASIAYLTAKKQCHPGSTL